MVPTAVMELARRDPAGLISRAQLAQAGMSGPTVSRLVARGVLERLASGLFRVAGRPVPPTQCLHVPVRYLTGSTETDPSALPPRRRALITGVGALAAMGVPGFPLPCRPTALVDRGRRVRVTGVAFDVQRAELRQVDGLRWQGVPTVTAARAIADLALDPAVSDQTLRQAVYDVVNAQRIRAVDLVRAWQAIRRVGAGRLVRMADAGIFDVESEGELDLYLNVFHRHPPLPDCQVLLAGQIRVDFVFLFAALVIEYVGGPHDGRADRDATRAAALQQLGHAVVFVSKSMVRDRAGLATHLHGLRREREDLMARGLLRRPPLPRQPDRLVPLRTLVPLG